VIQVIAHRGYSGRAPENTLAALRRGIEAGADAVEWDMHVAACGTPVLLHDETLQRTTNGSGAVREWTFDRLRQLDAGAWFAPEFAGEPVPSFVEALEEIRPSGAWVYPELKGYGKPEDLDRMVGSVSELGMQGRTVFISLDYDAADGIAARDRELRVGYVVDRLRRFPDALRRASLLGPRGMVDLDYRFVLVNPALVGQARSRGVDVAVWTVDAVGDAEALVRAGVRRLTTNQVGRLTRWRDARADSLLEA
jgi:glycerophosphoryl diester phosphodiesterase